jgi:beta-exotoxin I transport system permease protein
VTVASELFRRGIRDHRRALLGWCVGITAYVALVASIYPSIENSPELNNLIESYPDVLKSLFGITGGGNITSGAGYLDVELFSFMLPLLVLVLAIGSGARTLAGEEDAGRLELVFSYPVRRRDAVFAKGAALAVEVLLVCTVASATILAFDLLLGLDLSGTRVAAAFLSLVVLGLFFGLLALAVGAVYPSRALAIGVAAGAAATSYLVGGLHELAGWLDPFRFISPHWLVGSSPLQGGADLAGIGVVLLAAVAILGLGAILVERRDVEVP